MNRSKQVLTNPAGHVEITFTQTTSSMTFKGDPSVVQPMALAITRAQSVVHQQQLPPALHLPSPPASPAAETTATDDAAAPAVAQTELDFTPTPPAVVASPAPAKAPKKPRAYAPPGQVDSLRAEDPTDGFKVFVGARTAESDIDKGLLAAAWMRDVRKITAFDTSHVNTCFLMLAWKMPEDPGSLLRSMKKGTYVRPVQGKAGFYELTSKGNNRILELMK